MNYIYLITPFLTWFICGVIKFLTNSIKTKKMAFDLIGYGGMPSNHSAIVSSMVSLIGFKEGMEHPAFGVSLTLAFIVLLDANGLRKKMENHAIEINKLKNHSHPILRERIGHTKLEIFFGILIGICTSIILLFAL